MIIDSSFVNWRSNDFTSYDWKNFYSDVEEESPSKKPLPRGNPV
jgi:hypothetical protein